MEPIQNPNINKIELDDDVERPFCERPFEEVEDGYYDDRGFYTTPNGSFWDDEQTYFNHLGFDRHGGTYDKYGIYHPGPNYDEKLGLYQDQKELFPLEKNINGNEFVNHSISKLRDQEKKDEKTIKKYEQPVEESEEEDEDDKSNITFDEEDIKEAYNDVMEIENSENKNKDNTENTEKKTKYSMDVKIINVNENSNFNIDNNLACGNNA